MRRRILRRRILKVLCCFVMASQVAAATEATAYAKPDWPSDTGILAEAGIVIDADSGAVLYGQNIHNAYPPASITKLLTALLVLERCELDEVVEYSEHALLSVEPGSSDKLSLRAGDTLSVEDSLYALLLISVNQCANGLAEHAAGSMPAFVDLMNERVAKLGLKESHFDNPSGLNGDTQYVTAYDMAVIAREAYANEELLKISSTISRHVGPTMLFPEGQSFQHEHRLVYTEDPNSQYYCPEAVAGKTGYLLAAGNTLVTYGERDGRHVISVILKGKPKQYFVDGKTLLQFGLDRFQNINISEHETRYVTGTEEISLNGATYKASELKVQPGSVITLPKDASFEDAEVELQEELSGDAPIGAVALLVYTYNERQVGEAYLMADGTPVQVGTHGEEERPVEQEVQAAPTPGQPPQDAPDIPVGTILFKTLAAAAAALVIGGVSWHIYNCRKEARDLAARRKRRRERLQDEGADSQAEFDRLLQERRNRKP